MQAATDEVDATRASGKAADRWGVLWHAFFAATLLAPTVMTAATATRPLDATLAIGTATAFGLWHWWFAIRHQHWEGRLPMLVWFAGALTCTWALLGMDERFVYLVYGLYPQVFWLLGRYAIPGAITLTVMVFWRNGLLLTGDPAAWAPTVVGSVGLAVMVGMFVTALVRQNSARKAALEELEAARASLAVTAHHAGVLEERQRMARELHDTVAQGFTGIVMQLEACEQALATEPGRAQRHLAEAKASARDSLSEMRRAARAMRPAALEAVSLPEAVAAAVHRWSDETGTAATWVCAGTARHLDAERETALLRVCQEALANVAKHARAREVEVRLAYLDDAVELVVHDDGIGLPVDRDTTADGSGLQGLSERMAPVGGRLTIDSQPGAGTTLRARVDGP